jgi:hypothetical protein
VAVVRDIYQAVPVSGTWSGFPGSFLDMTVSVDARIDPSEPTAAVIGAPDMRKTG